MKSAFFKKQNISFVLFNACRFYLFFYMVDYGVNKLFNVQFNVNPKYINNVLVTSMDTFHLAWYLFSKSYFYNFVGGLLEVITGVSLVTKRFYLIGAFMLLPILANILLIDASFTYRILGPELTFRIVCMILCNLYIIFHEWDYIKSSPITKFHLLYANLTIWQYVYFTVIGFLFDFVLTYITYPILYLLKIWR